MRMRVKDHNQSVYMVLELLPTGGGDTAYLTVGCGSHAALWWGRAIVTVYNGQSVIAKVQVDSGTNLGFGDVWNHQSTNIHLGGPRPRIGVLGTSAEGAQGVSPDEVPPISD
jgi:hypothetical protein